MIDLILTLDDSRDATVSFTAENFDAFDLDVLCYAIVPRSYGSSTVGTMPVTFVL